VRTAVLGVVYKDVLNYFDDYLRTLNNQDCKDFDLFLFLDGTSIDETLIFCKKYNLNVIPISNNKIHTPAEIRSYAINFIIEQGYNRLVFSDTDDFIDPNRISKSLEVLNNFDFCFNNIKMVDSSGELLDDYQFYNDNFAEDVNNIDFLLDKNFIGLCNSALNLDKIDLSNFVVNKDIIAFDWFLFTFLLENGYSGKFIDDTTTYYRQYSNNIAGSRKVFDIKKIFSDINIAKAHYKYCLDVFKNECFSKKLDELCSLEKSLFDSSEFQEQYLQLLNLNTKKTYWWEHLKRH